MFYHCDLVQFVRPIYADSFLQRVAVKNQNWLVAAAVALMLAGLETRSYGFGPLPQTPCACAADGICRPNRESWGYSRTRWRAWPGDQLSQQPSQADAPSLGEDDEPPLGSFESPLPAEEDLRGPAKDKAKKSEKDKAADSSVGEPAIELPGLPELPAIDPQGASIPPQNPIEAPQMEDAPPALPASLRQAAVLMNRPRMTTREQSPASTVRPIEPASWQQPVIGLVNPASAAVDSEADALQQAIYYEASDGGNGSAE